MTVLAVDDEAKIREAVSDYLTHKGMNVLTAENGGQALELFRTQTVDFIILDLMLPDLTGEEVCRRIRERSSVPIIMLTAKSQEEDMLRGLAIGADDYIKKPFSLKELHARMQTVLRRSGIRDRVQNFGELTVDTRQMKLHKNGEEIQLTASEWKLLNVFLKHAGRVLSREQLIELAFGLDFDAYDRAIDTHIKNLRRKIECDPHSPEYIKTVHGMGYRFEVSR
ncbi:MAG: response regulator transcription factor [Oscillospiraceae bacterium]|nr:response regulator transcription factor [Oscillospiraceae bacterium]